VVDGRQECRPTVTKEEVILLRGIDSVLHGDEPREGKKRKRFFMMMTKEVGGKKVKMISDSTGYFVPVKNVDKIDLLVDQKVRKVVKAFKGERLRLDALMSFVLDVVAVLIKARGYGVADRGNVSFMTYDNLMRFEIVTRYKLELNEKAKEAKQMMLTFATSGLEEIKDFPSKQALFAFIEDVFTPSKNGCIRPAMVARLLGYKIVAKEWQDACAVLRTAMVTHRAKSYVNVSERIGYQSDWVTIRIDLADCWPEGFDVNKNFAVNDKTKIRR